jgi:parallel beta-helix repeat protein
MVGEAIFDEWRAKQRKVEYYRVLGPGNRTKVTHNILQHIGECGVCANSTVVVEDNVISYAGHELVDMHQSLPIIRNNILGPNPDHAGVVIDGGSPNILNNTIKGCGVGVDFISPPGNPILEGNTIYNNG